MRNKSQDHKPGKSIVEVVRQATAALATMDTERLEELAQCCEELNGAPSDTWLASARGEVHSGLDLDLRVLDQVLAETRANLSLLEKFYLDRVASLGRERTRPCVAEGAGRRRQECVSWEQ